MSVGSQTGNADLWRKQLESPGVSGSVVDRLMPRAAMAACSGVSVGGAGDRVSRGDRVAVGGAVDRASEESVLGATERLEATAGAWERRLDSPSWRELLRRWLRGPDLHKCQC